MQPKKMPESGQGDLFRARLDQILNPKHPLFILANQIDWKSFEEDFGAFFVEKQGRPGLPVRLVVGLHYLKYTFDESDESVVERFLENPYWQYFCGFDFFQHEFPLDPSSLVRWRKRIGPKGAEKLLLETVKTAKQNKLLKKNHVNRVNVYTTVQEKAIAFPTDSRLYHKMRKDLVEAAKEREIKLRQSYTRKSKTAILKQGRYRHARQMKRAKKETKKLQIYLGRVIRDIQRKSPHPDVSLKEKLDLAQRILQQKQKDKNKIYSVHAPEVECISKGKAHKKYEFGCKVSVVTTSKDNWIVGIDAIHSNPYDGHTLKQTLKQATRITGWRPKMAYCDRGYRGVSKSVPDVEVHLPKPKRKGLNRTVLKWLKRRSAIEPVIGHLKSDNRMEHNHLQGKEGDRINAMFSGCGFNMRKLLRAFLCSIFKVFLSLQQTGSDRIDQDNPISMTA
ncbi:MAG: IS5 family transposase [Deltaproteobacteria bacterium]|nr:IS5 family transposase [Deltaproteobacteria bacterium]